MDTDGDGMIGPVELLKAVRDKMEVSLPGDLSSIHALTLPGCFMYYRLHSGKITCKLKSRCMSM